MIAYRAEIWCNGTEGEPCPFRAGMRDGTAHDTPAALPQLAENLLDIRLRQGWTIEKGRAAADDRHYCPGCSRRRDPAAKPV